MRTGFSNDPNYMNKICSDEFYCDVFDSLTITVSDRQGLILWSL